MRPGRKRSVGSTSAPPGCRHKLIRIADSQGADLDAAIAEALPFLREALLDEPDGRVLVHCEAGMSRSASIVVAALIAFPQLLGAATAMGARVRRGAAAGI